jgi:glycosyltransferase involved in cell wall biosynthesis
MTERIALFLPSLRGGGAERVMVNLTRGFAERGFKVDLVLAKAEGPYLAEVPKDVRVVDLDTKRVLYSLPRLVRYLRKEQPEAMLSALDHANIVAIWAKRLSGVKIRLVVSVHGNLSLSVANNKSIRGRLMPKFIRQFYPWADSIVAVSNGVAEDLADKTGISTEKLRVIYNPVVTPELIANAEEPLDHPWFAPGEPPVILGMGRLVKQKDFPTLIRAFSLVHKERPARLIIISEGEEREKLEGLVRELGLDGDVEMPGFVDNPYKYMKKAAVFVLSSRWEGFGLVLAEALALGTPVVSTDCPSGPAEILEGGKWGHLVSVGDHTTLAKNILVSLEEETRISTSSEVGEYAKSRFGLDCAISAYSDILLGG